MCGDCNICESADTVLSEFIGGLEVETAHHRVDDQKIKCGLENVGLMSPSAASLAGESLKEVKNQYMCS